MGTVKDLTGQRFGRLLVIRHEGSTNTEAIWRCLCDCGKQVIVRGSSLRRGHTKSCGCLRDEIVSKIQTTHKKTKTRLYNVWTHIKARCYNPTHHAYKNYGERGITVCDEWKNDFPKFYEWAIANGYDENAPKGQCTIDRIDNDKGYSPDNCRWVDIKTQNKNKRKNKQEKKK